MDSGIAVTPGNNPPWVRFGPALGVALLALAAYATAIPNGFAQDDGRLIEGNPLIRSLENLPALFATDLFNGAYPAAMYYRPLVVASFALEYAVAGPTPFLHHLTNVLLHALICVLVYALAKRLFASQSLALVAAGLFAVHPVHTEAVAAISGRGDLLGAGFMLAAALLYAKQPGRIAPGRLFGILSCITAALLSKESSLVTLALFPLIDLVHPEARTQPWLFVAQRAIREKALFWGGLAIVVVAYGITREIVTASEFPTPQLGFMGDRHGGDAPLTLKLATCAKLLGIYFKLLVFPYELSADYDFNQIPLANSLFSVSSILPVLIALALVAAGIRWRRKHPALLFGIAFLLVGVLPVAFLLPFAHIPLAERYLYLPSLGLCVAVGAIVDRVPARAQVASLVAVLLLLILPGAARTALRNRDWRDNDTLWEVTAETSPNSSKAQGNRALSLATRAEAIQQSGGDALARELFQAAASHYERAVAIDPAVAPLRMQYGLCLAALGRYERAESELAAAAELGRVEALVALYRILITQSRLYAASSPLRALGFQRRADQLFRERIQPASPREEAARLAQELQALERQLQHALASEP